MGNYFSKKSEYSDDQPMISESDPGCVYRYKTLEIIKIIKEIESRGPYDKELVEKFLDIVPGSSNYLIQNELKRDKFGKKIIVAKIIDVYQRHSHSMTKIRDHLMINGLTDKCEIGLFPAQKKQLDELIYQSKTNPVN